MWTRTLLLVLIAAGVPNGAQQPADAVAARTTAALLACPQYTIFDDVSVHVADGVARLTGQVTSDDKRRDIAAHLARVPGVRGVTNEIEVLPVIASDAALRVRIAKAIYGHAAFWEYAAMARPPIHIVVSRGHVRLVGVVGSSVERALAQTLAAVDGVVSVRNELTSRSAP
jgi:osmotically-inducible protein OsmY